MSEPLGELTSRITCFTVQSSCCGLRNNSNAIGMRDGSAFGLAGIWENWKDPSTGEWVRTFAVITTAANALVADIHDRMPVILRPGDYDRWLGSEPDPRDLLRPFPAELVRMWLISTRVNTPRNDDPSLLEPVLPDSSMTPTQWPNAL